jgi:hypothetical protein
MEKSHTFRSIVVLLFIIYYIFVIVVIINPQYIFFKIELPNIVKNWNSMKQEFL